MFKALLGTSTVIAAVSSSVAALAQAQPLPVALGEPLGIQMPGAESGLMILAAAGVISGIYIARRKR